MSKNNMLTVERRDAITEIDALVLRGLLDEL